MKAGAEIAFVSRDANPDQLLRGLLIQHILGISKLHILPVQAQSPEGAVLQVRLPQQQYALYYGGFAYPVDAGQHVYIFQRQSQLIKTFKIFEFDFS